MSTEERIKKQISENSILLFMKGSPDKPQCGFSQRALWENPHWGLSGDPFINNRIEFSDICFLILSSVLIFYL